ncbi:hypothetical protein C7S15_0189 [Burkholderia cepacia]|nr:hypothetical protein [Burkholderia cepacia]
MTAGATVPPNRPRREAKVCVVRPASGGRRIRETALMVEIRR